MKTFTMTVTQEQIDVLAGFVNEVVKATGITAVKAAAVAVAALETAKEIEDAPLDGEIED